MKYIIDLKFETWGRPSKVSLFETWGRPSKVSLFETWGRTSKVSSFEIGECINFFL